jgi:hypothetical protein
MVRPLRLCKVSVSQYSDYSAGGTDLEEIELDHLEGKVIVFLEICAAK